MFCQICGANNSDESRFCVNCGADLAAQNAAQQPVEYETQVYAEQQYQEPVYAEPMQYEQPVVAQEEKGNGLAIASLICGIVSFFCCPLLASILAIVFGSIAKSKGCKSGMATAGIVLGVIGIVLAIIGIIVGIALGGLSGMMSAAAIEAATQTPYYY